MSGGLADHHHCGKIWSMHSIVYVRLPVDDQGYITDIRRQVLGDTASHPKELRHTVPGVYGRHNTALHDTALHRSIEVCSLFHVLIEGIPSDSRLA